MVKLDSPAVNRAKELQPPPEPGKPYSLPVPGSAQPGRSAVYRHWRFMDGLLETLDPNVGLILQLNIYSLFQIRTAHDFFEDTGKAAEPFAPLLTQEQPARSQKIDASDTAHGTQSQGPTVPTFGKTTRRFTNGERTWEPA